MAKKQLTWLPNETYHCQTRCINLRNLLADNWAKKMTAEVIEMTRKKYTFDLVGVECLDNQLNLTIRTVEGSENLSPVLQHINSQIAVRYNKEMKRTGPFWNGRSRYRIMGDCEKPAVSFVNPACTVSDSSANSGLYGI